MASAASVLLHALRDPQLGSPKSPPPSIFPKLSKTPELLRSFRLPSATKAPSPCRLPPCSLRLTDPSDATVVNEPPGGPDRAVAAWLLGSDEGWPSSRLEVRSGWSGAGAAGACPDGGSAAVVGAWSAALGAGSAAVGAGLSRPGTGGALRLPTRVPSGAVMAPVPESMVVPAARGTGQSG